jgi:AcrR family transcriptional regulator
MDNMAAQTPENGSTPAGLHMPASIQAAWGVAERATKGPRPALSVERIVAAGIEVADAEGLAAVSMSRVAKQLGTAPMSLYRYVNAKTELLDLMQDAAYGPPPAPSGPFDWRSGLTFWATSSLSRLYTHPWCIRIPVSGPPITPNQVRWMELGLSTLAGTGLSPAEKLSTILLVSGYVRNWVTLTTDLGNDPAAVTEAMQHYASDLRVLVDREHFPEISALVDSGTLDGEDLSEDDYAFGLERILDGVGVLVRSRS